MFQSKVKRSHSEKQKVVKKTQGKHEKIELLNLLDKCSQILKDDRLFLRTQLKEGNQEIENTLLKHRKNKNPDMHCLQTEIRKLVNKLKGKSSNSSSIFQLKQQHLQNENKKRAQSQDPEVAYQGKPLGQNNQQYPKMSSNQNNQGSIRLDPMIYNSGQQYIQKNSFEQTAHFGKAQQTNQQVYPQFKNNDENDNFKQRNIRCNSPEFNQIIEDPYKVEEEEEEEENCSDSNENTNNKLFEKYHQSVEKDKPNEVESSDHNIQQDTDRGQQCVHIQLNPQQTVQSHQLVDSHQPQQEIQEYYQEYEEKQQGENVDEQQYLQQFSNEDSSAQYYQEEPDYPEQNISENLKCRELINESSTPQIQEEEYNSQKQQQQQHHDQSDDHKYDNYVLEENQYNEPQQQQYQEEEEEEEIQNEHYVDEIRHQEVESDYKENEEMSEQPGVFRGIQRLESQNMNQQPIHISNDITLSPKKSRIVEYEEEQEEKLSQQEYQQEYQQEQEQEYEENQNENSINQLSERVESQVEQNYELKHNSSYKNYFTEQIQKEEDEVEEKEQEHYTLKEDLYQTQRSENIFSSARRREEEKYFAPSSSKREDLSQFNSSAKRLDDSAQKKIMIISQEKQVNSLKINELKLDNFQKTTDSINLYQIPYNQNSHISYNSAREVKPIDTNFIQTSHISTFSNYKQESQEKKPVENFNVTSHVSTFSNYNKEEKDISSFSNYKKDNDKDSYKHNSNYKQEELPKHIDVHTSYPQFKPDDQNKDTKTTRWDRNDSIYNQYKDLFTPPDFLMKCGQQIASREINKIVDKSTSINLFKPSTSPIKSLINVKNLLEQTPKSYTNYGQNTDVEKMYSHLFTNWEVLLGTNKKNESASKSKKEDEISAQRLDMGQSPIQEVGQFNNISSPSVPLQSEHLKSSQKMVLTPSYQGVALKTSQTTTSQLYNICNSQQQHDNIDELIAANTEKIENSVTLSEKMLFDSKIQNIKESVVRPMSPSNGLDEYQGMNQSNVVNLKYSNFAIENNEKQLESQQVSRLQTVCDFPKDQVKKIQQRLHLQNITAEDLFDEIFTDSSLAKISKAFFRFKIETIVNELCHDNYDLKNEDIDNFFELCDIKMDGFLDVNELGPSVRAFCKDKDKSENAVLQVFECMDKEQKGYFTRMELEAILEEISKKHECELDEYIYPLALAKELFNEVDNLKKGYLTYWDIYLCKNTYQFKRISDLIEKYYQCSEN